ncbi:DUF1811 family protein [Paenibacillus doosanensis]|uniref:Transcriptional regulator n=1 Tax=Paenibacillus konkukensis TaxID=2020716 RepID=A0ABY4RWX8_9BACL|nr:MULTISPECIES: DUF1811 family protein [Paenibacillus]MCS7459358.1 DUF1811 family protein [Paenibacillus doosanensis]UQZ87151.1 hypothetical protein SK3146_06448 [Paenibacillus konkukensis]
MKKLYSQMSPVELEAEMTEIVAAMEHIEFPSQKELLTRKYYTAKAYLLDPADFKPGRYKVEDFEEEFELKYINGIMGWGQMGKDPEASFPLSMLTWV